VLGLRRLRGVAGGFVFLAVWTVAALAVWWEWVGIVKADPRPVLIGIGAAAIAGMTVSLFADAAAFAFVCALVGAGVAMASVQSGRLWIAGGAVYAAAVLIPAVMLRSDPALGFVAILWLFAVVWAEDTGAYFAGRYFGGPKLAVRISPNKTWSGAIGGTARRPVRRQCRDPAGRDRVASGAFARGVSRWSSRRRGAICWNRRSSAAFAVKDASGLVPGTAA
jgi:phosphatidate cytidylyltransferase